MTRIHAAMASVDGLPETWSDSLDRTVAGIAKEAAHAKLPGIYQAVSKVKEVKRIADVAESAGDQETADAVRLALRGLAAEATI